MLHQEIPKDRSADITKWVSRAFPGLSGLCLGVLLGLDGPAQRVVTKGSDSFSEAVEQMNLIPYFQAFSSI